MFKHGPKSEHQGQTRSLERESSTAALLRIKRGGLLHRVHCNRPLRPDRVLTPLSPRIYMAGCQNYGPFWALSLIRHLIFRGP